MASNINSNAYLQQIIFTGMLVAALFLNGCVAPRFSYPDTDIRVDNLKQTVHFLSTLEPPRNESHPEKHLNATSVNVEILKAPSSITGVDFSDHRNYWESGYDAVMITDTSFFRNPHYHMVSDTSDTLDLKKMNAVVTGICWAILKMN